MIRKLVLITLSAALILVGATVNKVKNPLNLGINPHVCGRRSTPSFNRAFGGKYEDNKSVFSKTHAGK